MKNVVLWCLVLATFVILSTCSGSRQKRSAINDVFCTFPGAKPIQEIFPEIQVFRREHNRVVFRNYMNSAELVQSLQRVQMLTAAVDRVVFVTHGFTASINSQWLFDIKNGILADDNSDQMIVLIGWAAGAAPGWRPTAVYRQAAANTESIGRYIGNVARSIRAVDSDMRFYGVGHSLGAHVMGWAGRTAPGLFERITGLDPAGPCFETNNVDKRLKQTDATLVDVIHTDGYKAFTIPQMHYGTLIPLGDLDFYPNYGRRMQPGCGITSPACSHSRAIALYIQSLTRYFWTESVLIGTPRWNNIETGSRFFSEQVATMGYYADSVLYQRHGNFYLKTTDQAPWTFTQGNKYFFLEHTPSGKVLDACTDDGRKHGSDIYIYSYHGDDNQQWFFDDEGLIRNRKFWGEVLDWGRHRGEVYLTRDVDGEDNQRWTFLDDDLYVESHVTHNRRRLRLEVEWPWNNRKKVVCRPPRSPQASEYRRQLWRRRIYSDDVF